MKIIRNNKKTKKKIIQFFSFFGKRKN
ncbi:hypothetical protein, partial [Plasmodium yoelii yoelii]